jgi:hypothetical protein
MPGLESEHKQLVEAFHQYIVAYDGFTNKKIKGRSSVVRKHLKEMMDLGKEMLKSVSEQVKKM